MSGTVASDEPFLGNLTMGQYYTPTDEKKAQLGDEWADLDLMDLDEQEVIPDALPAE